MSDEIFYVSPEIGHDKKHNIIADRTHPIAAKFLVVNGEKVVDPNPQGSSQVNLYKKLDTNGRIDAASVCSNPHNYLIVPANYDPSEAMQFAGTVNAGMATATGVAGPEAGAAVGLAAMTAAFVPGGEQDLQRGERWGIPKGETAPAFRDSASWNLGFVTQMTALPNGTAVAGGGAVNIAGYLWAIVKQYTSSGPNPTQRLDGPLGMSEIDYQAFLSGVKSGQVSEKDGILGVYHWLRDHTLNSTKDAGPTLHDLALDLGQPGLGGFAPMGRTEPLRRKAVPKPQSTNGAAATAVARQVEQGGTRLPDAGETNSANAPSYKAVLAQAKALAAQQRQNRQAVSNGMYLPPSGNGLEGVSFAPIGAHGLGPATRFATRTQPSGATAEMPMSQHANFAGGTLAPGQALGASGKEAAGAFAAMAAPGASAAGQADLGRMVDDYVFRQSRLPPRGGAAFNPLLSPLWAGLKIPG
jgi:hypothetical protein